MFDQAEEDFLSFTSVHPLGPNLAYRRSGGGKYYLRDQPLFVLI